MTPKIRATGRTHVGLVRKRNEDSMYLGGSLIAVADGMGGHVSGDIASATAIEAIRAFDHPTAAGELSDTLGQAVSRANWAMRRQIVNAPELAGMGTTLVAVMWSGTSAVIANVGDSRGYLLRAGELQRLTDDHIYSRLVAHADQVPTLPEKISRFLDGRIDGRSPDLTPLQLETGDRVLICSDGLSSFVPHARIQALALNVDAEDAVEQLVTAALNEGGPDNITVILLDVTG